MQAAKLFLAGALLLSSRAWGQAPVLIDHAPQVGEHSTYEWYAILDTMMPSGGPDQLWDLTNADTWGMVRNVQFVAADTTLFGGLFPSAQVAEHESDGVNNIYRYLRSSSYGLELLGDGGGLVPDTGSAVMPSPERFLPAYCTYGTTWTDTSQWCSDSMVCAILYISCEADGYGTLQLPAGTVQNVLRTRCTWAVINGPEIHTTVFDRYWHPAFPYFLVTMSKYTVEDGINPIYTKVIQGELLADLSVGLAPRTASSTGLNVAYSSADQGLAITLAHTGTLDLKVLDAAGRTVHSGRLLHHDPSSPRTMVPIPRLSEGTYVLLLDEASGWRASRPFVVVR